MGKVQREKTRQRARIARGEEQEPFNEEPCYYESLTRRPHYSLVIDGSALRQMTDETNALEAHILRMFPILRPTVQ